jgi:hypothetical protein
LKFSVAVGDGGKCRNVLLMLALNAYDSAWRKGYMIALPKRGCAVLDFLVRHGLLVPAGGIHLLNHERNRNFGVSISRVHDPRSALAFELWTLWRFIRRSTAARQGR